MTFAKTRLPVVLFAMLGPVLPPAYAEPPPLGAYGNLPEVEHSAISPGGDGLAVIAQVGGDRQLLLFDAQRSLRSKASLGDIKLRDLRWAGEDRVIVVKRSTQALGPEFTADKHEFLSAIIVPSDASKAQTIFANRPAMIQAVFGDYGSRHVQGRWQVFFSGVEYTRRIATGSTLAAYEMTNGNAALFAIDVESNQPRRIAPAAAANHGRGWLVDGNGAVAATLDLDERSGRWNIVNAAGLTLAEGLDLQGRMKLVSLGKDGTTLIYRTFDEAAEKTRLYEVALHGGASSEVFANGGLADIYVDPVNGRLLGYLDERSNRPILFDQKQQAILQRIFRAFAKANVTIEGWTPDFSHVLFRTSGNGDSGTWYDVDTGTFKAVSIGAERPDIPPAQVGPISTVPYAASDGLQLDGILTLPPGKPARNLPVVMLPHGGPHAHDTATFDWLAQAFASRGYAVFQPNFRGSTNRDEAFRRAGYGQWGRKMQSDISDGLAELARQGIVDARRACIFGASYGGYAALAGVTLQQGLYRCAVAVAPVSDLGDMYWTEYRESGENAMIQRSLRASLGNPARFAEVSPRRNAARADAPILLIHGQDDTVVRFKQSAAMADALKDAGKPHELVVLREEDHWLSRAGTRKQMLEATMRFVQRHNPAD